MNLPGLKISFANMSDAACRDVLSGGGQAKPVRQRAFKKLVEELMPAHMRDEPAEERKGTAVEPLESISASAARGLVQAAVDGLMTHEQWIAVAPVMPRVEAAARL